MKKFCLEVVVTAVIVAVILNFGGLDSAMICKALLLQVSASIIAQIIRVRDLRRMANPTPPPVKPPVASVVTQEILEMAAHSEMVRVALARYRSGHVTLQNGKVVSVAQFLAA